MVVGALPSRIVLVRHGLSAHVHAGWIDHTGFEGWRAAYDAAGIAPHDEPPAALRALAGDVGCVVASDLLRAVESAARLAPARDVVHTPLLREASLPIYRCAGLRLPMWCWALVVATRWLREGATHAPRARDAAALLTQLAGAHGSVLAVTHGAFRRSLAAALVADGWARTARRGSIRHWSAWELTRAPGATDP